MTACTKPLPSPTDTENRRHWQAAREGMLMLQRCEHCAAFRFPAASICPHCRKAGARWEKVSGRGVVESFCRFHKAYWPAFAGEVPYTVLLVRLDEGVRMYSNPAGMDANGIGIGTRVEATFEPVTDDVGLVKFQESRA